MDFSNSNSVSFILELVGCNFSGDLSYMDKLQNDLDVDIYDAMDSVSALWEEVMRLYARGELNTTPINYLIEEIFNLFVGNVVSEHGEENISEENFSYYINAIDSHIYFNGEEFRTRDEFYDLFNAKSEEDEEDGE